MACSRTAGVTFLQGEGVDSISRMVRAALEENKDTNPTKSVLAKARVKIAHPDEYSSEPNLEKFKMFITSILRWLVMNLLLGPGTAQSQVRYLGTRLKGDALEWFTRNVE